MWPLTKPAEEAAAAPPPPTLATTQPEALETPEIAELIAPEEEKAEIPPVEMAHDIISEPEQTPDPIPAAPEMQAITDPEPASEDASVVSEAQPIPKSEPTPAPAPSQTVIDPQPGDMVYGPGFGWLECQGPGEVIHDTEIYENGNKIGVMG